MPRYIDIDDTVKTLKKLHGEESTLLNCYNADFIVSFLESQPTADVQDVRHGMFVATGKYMTDECSKCGFEINWNDIENIEINISDIRFCPHCGAKMDGKENKNEYE